MRHCLVFLSATLLCSASYADNPVDRTRRWVSAKLSAQSKPNPNNGFLRVSLRGKLLKNYATTKVYHTEVGVLPLKIADKEYRRGLYCPSTGTIEVHLPKPGRTFRAVFGVDSNRINSFYSNAGRGDIIGIVEVGGREVLRTKRLREGIAGVPIKVDLNGATSFTLKMIDGGGGVVERVDFNQSDWAQARVRMEDDSTLWLGDMPTAPLRADDSVEPPFSFTFNGVSSREFLKNWQRDYSTQKLSNNRTEHTVTFREGPAGLEVIWKAIVYGGYPVVEWKLTLRNRSKKPSPIIENVLPLDTSFERDSEEEFLLHHSNGSPHSLIRMSDPTDYAPRRTPLGPQSAKTLSSKIGLPASHDLPFFNVALKNEGVIVAIGWPGQWTARLQRDQGRKLHLTAGQALTRFRLKPVEEVRTPLIAMLFWQGADWIDGQNLWRRWMVTHNLPRADGVLPPPQHAASSSAFYIEMSGGTEANQVEFVNRYLKHGIKPDYWWVDAGWYEYDDYWLNVGTWTPNKKRFPRGLRPISDHLHRNDMKMILWLAPEHVSRGSWLDRNGGKWILKGGSSEWWMGHALLQGEVAGHVNDSGLTLIEDLPCFGSGNPTSTIMSRHSIADGKWHLVTATRAVKKDLGQSELRLYVDGKLEASGTSANVEPLRANDSWGAGRQYQTRGINGEMDDIRIYHSALSADQIRALFEGRESVRPAQHYTFDDSLEDAAGGKHGKRIGLGGPHFVAGRTKLAADRSLKFQNDYGVRIPNATSADFTLSCWVRMDAPQPPPWGRGDFRMLDLGNPEAVQWLTDHVDKLIREQGVDLYRHDGPPPLGYWKAKDLPDRQGMAEVRHIEGLLRYWDELKSRHPGLRIDICSGGGSRNELEALRRAVPLWRSDYAYEPTGMQALTYGMSLWIPYFGTGTNAFDSYTFRSQMAPAIASSWDMRRDNIDAAFIKRMLGQWRSMSHHYFGDFYPLTRHSTSNDTWMAWQFDSEELGGMVQAFRRPESPAVSMQFRLRGLVPNERYLVQNFDLDDKLGKEYRGKELMEKGLSITIPEARGAALISYRIAK